MKHYLVFECFFRWNQTLSINLVRFKIKRNKIPNKMWLTYSGGREDRNGLYLFLGERIKIDFYVLQNTILQVFIFLFLSNSCHLLLHLSPFFSSWRKGLNFIAAFVEMATVHATFHWSLKTSATLTFLRRLSSLLVLRISHYRKRIIGLDFPW